jgi:hypothetical protein
MRLFLKTAAGVMGSLISCGRLSSGLVALPPDSGGSQPPRQAVGLPHITIQFRIVLCPDESESPGLSGRRLFRRNRDGGWTPSAG